MCKVFYKYILYTAALFLTLVNLNAQTFYEPKIDSDWVKPYQPFKIAGNLYYVGTYELGCFLVTTTKGNILINTGTSASFNIIKNNIETLGFKLSDIKILLTNQAHYDHVGAMAVIKKLTGARLMVDQEDANVLATGGKSDYELGKYGETFLPGKADRLLHNNDTIGLGDMQLTVLHHPGHTKGSCSFLFTVKDENRSYTVLIANLPTIIVNGKLSDVKLYPSIEKDYAYTLSVMKNISFDLWLAPHAGQFNLLAKHKPNDLYNPEAFRDRTGYIATLNELQKTFDEKVK